MAGFDPYAPYGAPPAYQPAPLATPWDDDMERAFQESMAQQAAAPQPAPMQPGLGVPQALLDQNAPDQIEMPVDYVGKPTIGEPRVPEMPAPIDAEPMFELPPSQVDAVSGGDINPPGLTPGELQSEQLSVPQDPREQYTPDEEAYNFAALSPEERARKEYDFVQTRDAEERARRADAATADEQRALANQTAMRKARDTAMQTTQRIEQEARQLAEMNVDPERWWNSRNTPQAISGVIAAMLGGLVQHLNGGRNAGLAMIDNAIERDIDAQKANIANKRAGLQMRGQLNEQTLAQTQASFEDEERFRIAAYGRVQNKIAEDMQQYDPAGKNAIEMGKMYADIGAKRQQAVMDLQDKTYKQQIEALKNDADLRKTYAEIDKAQAEAAKLRGQLGSGGAGASGILLTPDQIRAKYPGIDPALVPDVAMSDKEFKARIAGTKAGAEASKALGESLADAVPDIATADGQPYRARSKEDADELTDQKAAVDQAVEIVDNVLRLRKIHGWTPSLWNSPEYQQMKADWAALLLQKKNVEKLGALSGSDIDLVNAALGSSDPASQATDPTPGIRRFRHNTVQQFNKVIIAKRRQGTPKPAPYAPADLSGAEKPTKSTKDTAAERAMGLQEDPVKQLASSAGVTLRTTEKNVVPGPDEEGVVGVLGKAALENGITDNQTVYEVDDNGGGMSADQKEAIDLLVEEGAVDHLKNVATTATAPGTRAYAQARLLEAYAAKARGDMRTEPKK